MSHDLQERLERLEHHLTHLEHQVDQLNEVVIAQGRQLERLKKEVQRQSSVLQTMELERVKANNARPPHY